MIRIAILFFTVANIGCACFAEELTQHETKAKAGDFDAMLQVGLAYLSDDDTKNNGDGVKWLEMSSAGGNITAYYNLGAIYQEGTHVKQDAQKAIMFLTVAAELGEIRAMNRLAGIYYIGKLIPANDILAVKWGLCAAGMGSENAKRNVGRMKAQIDDKSAALGAKAAAAWVKMRMGNNAIRNKAAAKQLGARSRPTR